MIELQKQTPVVRLFARASSWIEGDAERQLRQVAELEGMLAAVGLPDLHPGKGGPVGAAFAVAGIIYPHLVGSDIGCGMGLFQTDLKAGKVKRDKWAKKLSMLQSPWPGDVGAYLNAEGLTANEFDSALGTIGGGNHFAELQAVDKIYDADAVAQLGLNRKQLVLLVHSGSRGFGASVLDRHVFAHGNGGLCADTEAASEYLQAHDRANRWARANRNLIARRFAAQLGGDAQRLLDASHNFVAAVEIDGRASWLHRKGVVSGDQGPVVVPGSRGTLSYLVAPTGDQQDNLWSLAHGAGRKWNRGSCKARIKPKYPAKTLMVTPMGNRVICEDTDLLFEEAPQAYKSIAAVIEDMQADGLIRVLATLKPVITYKKRKRV